MSLPVELAPALRERAEALLAECRIVDVASKAGTPGDRDERSGRGACYVCHGTRGAMGGHHVIPGDDRSVVPVHPACHRRLHRKARTEVRATA